MRKVWMYIYALFICVHVAHAQPVNQPPGPPVSCNNAVVYDAATNGATQLVALAAGKQIYVCGYTLMAGGTVTVKLEYGTGSVCATGTTVMTPGYPLVAQSTITDSSPFYRGLATPAGNALCLLTNAAVAVQAIVYYGQY